MTARRFGVICALTLLLATCSVLASDAGDLVNATKEEIAVQKGVREPKSGEFTWSTTIVVKPGAVVKLGDKNWYRYDTHVGDGKVTWSPPGMIGKGDPRDYFLLFGNEVRIDVVKK